MSMHLTAGMPPGVAFKSARTGGRKWGPLHRTTYRLFAVGANETLVKATRDGDRAEAAEGAAV